MHGMLFLSNFTRKGGKQNYFQQHSTDTIWFVFLARKCTGFDFGGNYRKGTFLKMFEFWTTVDTSVGHSF